jgi:flagellar basal-body rod protein FlgC
VIDSAFEVAASGMAAHRAEMDVIAENLANASTARADGSAPYRSRTAVFERADGDAFEDALDSAVGDPDFGMPSGLDDDDPAAGVRLAGVVESGGPPQLRFDPANPLAIASGPRQGYVEMPDVDPIGQMVALVSAGRAYDADVAALQAAKQMDVEAVEMDGA